MIHTRFFFLLFFSFAFSIRSFSQKVNVHVFMENKKNLANSDLIYYDFNRRLTWKDFQGVPDMHHFGGAVTSSGFAFNSEMNFDGKNMNLIISVYSYFSKKKSWKKSSIHSDYHLLHEQHHFDITRLGAQRLIDEFQKANFTQANYNTLMNSIFDIVYDENRELQEQYDRETKNSINVKKQLEWNEKITAELKKLEMNVAIQNGQ
jgi:hypothetical protein